MIKRKLYSRVNWRKYLDPTNKQRVQRFIKTNGPTVFTAIVETIENAMEDDLEEVMILVHPNVSSVAVVSKDEYDEVLTHCLQYFESIEKYENCDNILAIKNNKKIKI